jgi:hypothetical protein
MTIYLLLLLSVYAVAFETTICNCKDPIRQEHLRIDDDKCQPIRRPTQRNADYAVWTDRKDGLKVRGYVCSRWEKINHISTNLFLQQIVVPDKRAVDTTEAECKIMAQTKRCEEMPMKFADGKWLYVPEPSESGVWMRTISTQVLNCMVEETIILQEENDLIDTPLGRANISDGVHTHNHMTLIWDVADADRIAHTPWLLTQGKATITQTSTATTFKLEDDSNQLAYHITHTDRCIMVNCESTNNTFAVAGDKHLFIVILKLGSEGNKTSDLILDRTASKPTTEELEYIRIRDDYYTYPEARRTAMLKLLQSHVQYLKDKTLDHENEILRAAHDMNCQITRLKHSLAIAAAQYDGWLAASILGLPTCVTLQAKGMTVLMKECRAEKITFTTETTTCGPQPRYENSTISQNGWELTTYQPCYWSDHYVNFNGKHYVYRNDTWKLAEATVIPMEQDWPVSFRYIDDNSYKYQPSTNPGYKAFITSPMNIMADMTAAMAEQSIHSGAAQEITPLTPVQTIIMTAAEKTHVSGQMSWWETFKLILFITSLVFVFAFLIAFLRYFGIFALIFAMCCKPRPRLHSSRVHRRRREEVLDSSPPIALRDLLPPLNNQPI